ncbi:MAG TPA: GNAT family N-acetyltransferase [Devosiaceae bacterium]|nr:GNAT family N-acetyltransferase [Devosiaceae bacterium]
MASRAAQIPLPDRYDVRKAEASQVAELAETLAHAFYDEPLISWIAPNPSSRLAISRRGFELWLRRVWLRHEETYIVGGPTAAPAGVCVWEPPGTWKMGAREQLSLLPAMLRASGRTLPRLLRALGTLEKDHPEEPHFYLPCIGVRPENRGQGGGSILMRPVLERCDDRKVPAYLEASSTRSRALYERHGFEVTEEIRPGRNGPPMWRMWRDPA